MHWKGISACILVTTLSICVASLSYYLYSVIFEYHLEDSQTFWDFSHGPIVTKNHNHPVDSRPLTQDSFVWFIHLSDIHISHISSVPNNNFLEFLDRIVPKVSPLFFLATGDITDSKLKGSIKTRQIQEEWDFYYNALSSRNINSSFWFDLPGNHDRFDVSGLSSNLFSRYGIQSKRDNSSLLLHTIDSKIGNIHVLSIDASPIPGLGRPLNFYGHVNRHQMDQFEKTTSFLRQKNASTLRTIAISHYPICTLSFAPSTSHHSFTFFSQYFSLFLSGHLHNLVWGLGDELMVVHDTGFAEVEVGDLQYHRHFNIYSFTDRDTFSWSSHDLSNPILLHIISPKDSRFILPAHEKKWIGRNDNNDIVIDMLLFKITDIPIKQVIISIDEKTHMISNDSLTLPYFSFAFKDSKDLNPEISHCLSVSVILESNVIVTSKHNFSLSFMPTIIDSPGSRILSFAFFSFFHRMFWTCYFLLLILIINFVYFTHVHNKKANLDCVLYKALFCLEILFPFIPLVMGMFITDINYWQLMFFRGMVNISTDGSFWALNVDFPIFFSIYFCTFVFPVTVVLILEKIFTANLYSLLAKMFFFIQGTFFLAIIIFNYGFYSFLLSPGVSWIYCILLVVSAKNSIKSDIPKTKAMHTE